MSIVIYPLRPQLSPMSKGLTTAISLVTLSVATFLGLSYLAHAKKNCALTVSYSGTGTGTTSPSAGAYRYVQNSIVSARATAASGSYFSNWLLDGASYAQNPISVRMNRDHALVAVFSVSAPPPSPTYTLAISYAGSGSGTTNPAAGSYSLDSGASVTVTATASVGCTFDHWTANGILYTGNPIAFTMASDVSLVAYFTTAINYYTLTISSSGSGSTNPAAGSYRYAQASVVTVTATPSSGYSFDHWLLDGTSTYTQNPIDITMVSDTALVAYFIVAPPAPLPDLTTFHTSCWECSPESGWSNDASYAGTRPQDYISIPASQGGHRWIPFQWWFTIGSDGSAKGDGVFSGQTFDQQINWVNAALGQGYGVSWEASLDNILTVSDTALATFMRNLNSRLIAPIIWVNLNEFNGQWYMSYFGWSSWPPPQSQIDAMNAKMQLIRQIRDAYGLTKIRLAFAPTQDTSGISWELPIDWFKPGLEAGDVYTMSSYFSQGSYPYNWAADADNFFKYLTSGSSTFGGYNGGYNDKPWILHEFGHKEWAQINPAVWVDRIYYNIATRRNWLKLVIFWGPMDFTELAKVAPPYEGT